jgi:Uma2 family endonuclease
VVTSKVTMNPANVRYTYQDYLQLPEDKRYEILDGELNMVPAPNMRHQRLLLEIFDVLFHHVRERKLGEVFIAPCDVVLSDGTVVQPDILFVSKERLGIIGEANITGAPDLVVEILSPSTGQRDLGIKRNLYARYGVREYWIVDPESKTVEVLAWAETGYRTEAFVPETSILKSSLFPDLNLSLTEIFRHS